MSELDLYRVENKSSSQNKYFIRYDSDNDEIFNPIAHNIDEQSVFSKSRGQDSRFRLVSVKEDCFNLYKEFLKTKNTRLLTLIKKAM